MKCNLPSHLFVFSNGVLWLRSLWTSSKQYLWKKKWKLEVMKPSLNLIGLKKCFLAFCIYPIVLSGQIALHHVCLAADHRLENRCVLRHISNMNFQSWAVLGNAYPRTSTTIFYLIWILSFFHGFSLGGKQLKVSIFEWGTKWLYWF